MRTLSSEKLFQASWNLQNSWRYNMHRFSITRNDDRERTIEGAQYRKSLETLCPAQSCSALSRTCYRTLGDCLLSELFFSMVSCQNSSNIFASGSPTHQFRKLFQMWVCLTIRIYMFWFPFCCCDKNALTKSDLGGSGERKVYFNIHFQFTVCH